MLLLDGGELSVKKESLGAWGMEAETTETKNGIPLGDG